jgi:hypothetical protein
MHRPGQLLLPFILNLLLLDLAVMLPPHFSFTHLLQAMGQHARHA